MTEDTRIGTVAEAADQIEATAAVLRQAGERLPPDEAAAIARNLRAVADAVERIPLVAELVTQLEAAAALLRAHGLGLPADLAAEIAANVRALGEQMDRLAGTNG